MRETLRVYKSVNTKILLLSKVKIFSNEKIFSVKNDSRIFCAWLGNVFYNTRVLVMASFVSYRFDGTIKNFILEASVLFEVSNVSDHSIEFSHVFRGIDECVLFDFEVRVGEKVFRGECKEKKESEAVYDDALSSGSTAYLVTYKNGCISISVGNLQPSEKAEIVIRYFQGTSPPSIFVQPVTKFRSFWSLLRWTVFWF